MSIVQPRLGDPSTWALPVIDLMARAERIKPVAQKAFAGQGEFCAGDWCRFCRAKFTCRARNEQYGATVSALEAFGNAKPPLITNAELGEILLRAAPIAAWVEDLREYALGAILRGEEVDGWKAVEGRSNRQFSDIDAAFGALTAIGYEEALLYERKPITLTAVEKLTGKPKFAELLGPYIIKPPGKPTLAEATDAREAINLKPTAAEAFAAEPRK